MCSACCFDYFVALFWFISYFCLFVRFVLVLNLCIKLFFLIWILCLFACGCFDDGFCLVYFACFVYVVLISFFLWFYGG